MALSAAADQGAQPALPALPEPVVVDPASNAPPLPEVPAARPAAPARDPIVAKADAAPAASEPAGPPSASPAWPGWLFTTGGAQGGLALPTLAMPGEGKLGLAASFDYHRGGDFLFPQSTSQRSGAALSASYGAASWLEAYGALAFHSTNLFEPAMRRTLGSYGDFDAGVKLALPRRGPLSGGALVELDVPSGVGGFSLKGVGGRAALIAGFTAMPLGLPLAATVLAGYRIDNSGQLTSASLGTFASYALSVSRYDRAYGGLALAMPFRQITPSAELELDAPVGRQTALPAGGTTLLSRLTLGAQVLTPAAGLALQGGVRLSLSHGGRLSDLSLPVQGFAPDPPWQVFAGLAWSFEPQMPRWSRDQKPPVERLEPAPAAPTPRAVVTKAHVNVVALDARTRLPVAGAWVAWAEGGEPGVVTSLDGKARLEHEAGLATVAVAHEKYELFTDSLTLAPGEERQLSLALVPNEADSTLRGRIAGEDAVPLRASLQPIAAAAGKPLEPRWFEGSYSFAVPHGQYTLQIASPGFRADSLKLEVRPGETVTQDVLLRRIAGEPTARLGPQGVELSRPVPFVPTRSALFPVAFPVLNELAALLQKDGRAFVIEVRVEGDDLAPGGDLETEGQALSADRARAVADYLQGRGVPKGKLRPRGGGLARAGQLLFEAIPEDEKPERTQAAPADDIIERLAALGGRP